MGLQYIEPESILRVMRSTAYLRFNIDTQDSTQHSGKKNTLSVEPTLWEPTYPPF